MEKEKGIRSNWLADGVGWIVNNKFLSVFIPIVVAFVLVLVILVSGFAYFLYTELTTTPEMRMAVLEETFIQCLEMGMYPETCESIAAEAAGLANDD